MHEEAYGPSMTSGRGQRGTLEQLDDGRWRVRYREDGRNGKRPQKTFAPNRKREAERWLRDRLGDVEDAREGDRRALIRERHRHTTGSEAMSRFLATLDVAAPTLKSVKYRLRVFENEFGKRVIQTIEPDEMEAWRLSISPGWRADVFQETRRMMRAWDRWGWIPQNPTEGIVNRRPRRAAMRPIPWEHLLLLEEEIDRRLEHVPVLAGGTGLRIEEWLALERRDVDGDVLHVRRVWSSGRLIELGADGSKTHRQRRRVPLRACVLERLEALPRRIDTPLLVPSIRASRTGHLTDTSFRRLWRAAFDAAGLPYQRPYDMRHTYATESIAAGVNLFDLSRFMGTSLREIDETYGHLVSDAEERNREALDAYDLARAIA
jgi:integrase